MSTHPGEHPTPDEVDALLDDAGEPGLRAHVAVCDDCRAVLRRQREVRDLLAGLADTPTVPAQVSQRWLSALVAEPAFGASSGSGQVDDGPPDFSAWPTGTPTGREASGPRSTDRNPRARSTTRPVQAAGPGVPGVPRTAHPTAPHDGAPGPRSPDPHRARRMRMAVALAAGFTLLVGAGAATWTTFTRQEPSVSAAEAPPPASAASNDGSGQEGAMRDAEGTAPDGVATPDGVGPLVATEPGAAAADSPADARSSSAPTDEAFSIPEEQVRTAVASQDLRWPGVTSAADARERAGTCLVTLGVAEPVLAVFPGTRQGTDVQVIVSEDGNRWRVSEVSPSCAPGETPLGTTFVSP